MGQFTVCTWYSVTVTFGGGIATCGGQKVDQQAILRSGNSPIIVVKTSKDRIADDP